MVPAVKITSWEQLSPFIFFTKISLLPDGSTRWLPEEMFLAVTSWGKNFPLEQERAFIFHQKGRGLRQRRHSGFAERTERLAGKRVHRPGELG